MIGTTQLTLKKEQGQFFCPECVASPNYKLKVIRQFITVYFITVIPLGNNADFVECQVCQGTFHPEILLRTREAIRKEIEEQVFVHILRVMVLTMIADGTIENREVEAIQAYYRSLTGKSISHDEIAAQVQQARRARVTANTYAASVAKKLGDLHKDRMIQGAFLVATSAGNLQPPQLAELTQLPQALGVDEKRFRYLIEELV